MEDSSTTSTSFSSPVYDNERVSSEESTDDSECECPTPADQKSKKSHIRSRVEKSEFKALHLPKFPRQLCSAISTNGMDYSGHPFGGSMRHAQAKQLEQLLADHLRISDFKTCCGILACLLQYEESVYPRFKILKASKNLELQDKFSVEEVRTKFFVPKIFCFGKVMFAIVSALVRTS